MRQWVWYGIEILITLLALVWLVTGLTWALFAWEGFAVTFLLLGLLAVWSGGREGNSTARNARRFAALAWILPVTASLTGVSGAITALALPGPGGDTTPTLAASVGVVIAWAMMHVGFADIYQSLVESEEGAAAIHFRGDRPDAYLNYLYLSFTIGTAFATSDSTIESFRVRRVAMVHGVVSFLFNALVVAAAISVIQGIVAR